MSLGLKTVVNPKSHTHELVALSTCVHPDVQLDGPTEMGHGRARQLTAIRPLGISAGENYPAKFPHDMQNCIESHARTKVQVQGNERALLSW